MWQNRDLIPDQELGIITEINMSDRKEFRIWREQDTHNEYYWFGGYTLLIYRQELLPSKHSTEHTHTHMGITICTW